MDNLGVAMNATTIEAYALSKGIDTAYVNMDNATKVGLAMEMFLEKTAYAADNYAKENKTFAGSFNTLKAATSNFLSGAGGIEDVADALVGFGGILVESIGNMAPTIVEGLVQLTETLLPQIPILIESLLPTVLDGAIALINGLIAIFPALLNLIQSNLPTIINGGLLIIQTLLNAILSMLPQILEMGITILTELISGISQSLPELIPVIIETIMLMFETIIDNIDTIIEAGIEILLALVEGIMNSLPKLIQKIPEIITKIVSTLTKPEMLTKMIGAALQLMLALAGGLIKAIPDMVAMIPQIIRNLFDSIKETIKNTDWLELGKNVLKGILDGMLDFGTIVKDTIKKVGNKITNAIKDFFGIHSPSKLMKDEVGKYIAQGLGVGFEDEIDSVYNDMQRALDLETGKMTANVQASGTYQMAMAGTPVFNLLDNTSNTTQLVVSGKVLAEVVNTENKNREVATS